MDKDLLRIVIIAIGAVVILGMILWSVFRGGKRQKTCLAMIKTHWKILTRI